MKVLLDNRQDKLQIDDKTQQLIKQVVCQCLKHENVNTKVEVSISIVDNQEIHKLNRYYRNIDRPTDVLSFPLVEFENYDSIDRDLQDIYTSQKEEVLLGDIVISAQRAMEQATEYNHSFEREMAFLTVHGVLHLLGYDHLEEEDKKIMRNKEEAILFSLNIQRNE
jgi:probable rRNA maturation factor